MVQNKSMMYFDFKHKDPHHSKLHFYTPTAPSMQDIYNLFTSTEHDQAKTPRTRPQSLQPWKKCEILS